MSRMEKIVEVAGGTVWAEDTGGAGAPVVLLHPRIGDSRRWDPIVPRLPARYRPDHPAAASPRSPAADAVPWGIA